MKFLFSVFVTLVFCLSATAEPIIVEPELCRPSTLVIDKMERSESSETLRILDSVFLIPKNTPKITVVVAPGLEISDTGSANGRYFPEEKLIKINEELVGVALVQTELHELFHWISNTALKTKYPTEEQDATRCETGKMAELIKEFEKTPSYLSATTMMFVTSRSTAIFIIYRFSPEEMFARAMTQWAINKYGRSDLKKQVSEDIKFYPLSSMFLSTEFVPVSNKIDELIAEISWIEPKK